MGQSIPAITAENLCKRAHSGGLDMIARQFCVEMAAKLDQGEILSAEEARRAENLLSHPVRRSLGCI